MKRFYSILLLIFLLLASSSISFAHFGMIIPSDSMVMLGEDRNVNLKLSFSHPFEMAGMDLVKPLKFEMVANGNKSDILPLLKEARIMGKKAWYADYRINRPGIYWFHMEPEPYWEPAEDCYIVHYTKTIIAAFGEEAGWDKPLGIKTEIVPLTRPFGLYAGNLFRGIVLVDGKPAPGTEVEVEYYNKDKANKAPNDYFITQVVKADENGIFSYVVPRAGWWGFAGLNTSNEKIMFKGEEKNVEIGAVLWIEFKEMK